MAGDWIKVEHTTPDKPEVIAIADALGIDQDAAFGKLVRLWIWADQQTVDGNASVTLSMLPKSFIDRISRVTGFADAVAAVGWLSASGGGFAFPHFDRHNGQTAKQRAVTARRVASHRKRKCNADTVTKRVPREEKRRDISPIVPTGTCEGDSKPSSSKPAEVSCTPAFLAFWEVYPPQRRTAKLGAWRAWQKAIKRAPAQTILKAARAFAQSPLGQGRYCPGPEPWLNKGRWDDDRTAWQRSGEEPDGPAPAVEAPMAEY